MKTNQNELTGVGLTSLLVAAMRAVESRRSEKEGRLFSDPFAENLAGELGFKIMQRALNEVGDQPAIAVRTAFVDEKFNKALKEGIRQIVILAAGMDSRSYRLDFPPGTKVFELDRPEVLNYKKEKLHHVQAKCMRFEIEVDLNQKWQSELISAGFNPLDKTLWLVEGLLMYLTEDQVIHLFQKINSFAKHDDLLVLDVFTRHLLETPHMQPQLNFLASLNAPWKFGTNDPGQFLATLGWKAKLTQPGEFAPNRWPFPVAPLHIPNIPRSFFVEARKV